MRIRLSIPAAIALGAAFALGCAGRLVTETGDGGGASDAGEDASPLPGPGPSPGPTPGPGPGPACGDYGEVCCGGYSCNDLGLCCITGTCGYCEPDAGVIYDAGVADVGIPGCKAPPMLNPSPAGTIYCGFGPNNTTITCTTGQECCIGGSLGGGMYAPDQCQTWGSTCDNPPPGDAGVQPAIALACDQPADCEANEAADGGAGVCCLQATGGVQQVPGCPADLDAKGGTGSVCEAQAECAPGELQLCQMDSECPSAAPHCLAFRWKIVQLGYCAP